MKRVFGMTLSHDQSELVRDPSHPMAEIPLVVGSPFGPASAMAARVRESGEQGPFAKGPPSGSVPAAANGPASLEIARRLDRTIAILESLLANPESWEMPGSDPIRSLAEIVADLRQPPAPLEYPLPDGFRLSVVIPVYNEEATAARILAQVLRLPLPLQIVVVDDRSTDRTREVLQPFQSLPELRIIAKAKNEGKGAALRTGFSQATGDVVIVQDADLEYDPRDIPRLIQPIVEGSADRSGSTRTRRPAKRSAPASWKSPR